MKIKMCAAALALGIASLGLTACGGMVSDEVAADDGYVIDVLKLDGTETLAIEPDPRLAPTEQSTIEFWVEPTWTGAPGYDPVILSNAGDDGASYMIAITEERDGLVVVAGETLDAAPYDFTDGKMHHVALVDYGDSVSLFIDNEPIADLAQTFEDLPTNGLFIGSGSGGDDGFEGSIAGVRIWNVAVEPENLAKYARTDIMAEPLHPDLSELKLISDFANRNVRLAE